MPILTGLNAEQATTEGTTILLDSDVSFSSVRNDFDGGKITVSGLATGDVISVKSIGSGSGEIELSDSTGMVSFEGVEIGTVLEPAAGTATISLNAAATSVSVDALLQAITFTATADTPDATRTLMVDVVDATNEGLSNTGGLTRINDDKNPFFGIQVGNFASPRFVDIDNDGDLDVFVGNFSGKVEFFRNDGSADDPNFSAVTGAENPLNLVSVAMAVPDFVDIDNDGDLDVFIGKRDGTINFYRNDGSVSNPNFTATSGANNPLDGVDIGSYASPAFTDIDNDGDQDAFIGELNGKLIFYRNDGTAITPDLNPSTANPFVGVDIGFVPKASFVDIDEDGDLDVFLGEGYGPLFSYRNDGPEGAPVFTAQTGTANLFNGVHMGFDAAPEFVDIDNDGDLDAFVGRSIGKLSVGRTNLAFFEASVASTTSVTIEVTSNGNVQSGTAGDDVLRGGAGSDTLNGGDGNDALWAGAGDDAGDEMIAGAGDDTIGGGAGDDLLAGGAGADVVFGGSDNDIIWGDDINKTTDLSADTIWAGSGDDQINGAAGADEIGGGAGDDTVSAGAGNDVVYGGKGDGADTGTNDVINGETGNDTLFGAGGNDALSGGDGNDILYNGGGNDTVTGDAGDDTLWGGGGDDQLAGGAGSDVFAFAVGNGNDTVTDFSIADDTLDLSELNFADLVAVTAISSDTADGLLLSVDADMTITVSGLTVNDIGADIVTI